MKKLLLTVATIGLTALAPIQQAAAHVGYLDLINNPAAVISSTADSTTYFYGQAGLINGNFGFADAADGNWGDSHHAGWAKFDITDPAGAYISLSVFSDGRNEFNFDVPSIVSDFNPGLSLYSGEVPDESHEDYSSVPSGKGGSWNALGNTFMANENGESNTIYYLTHVAQDQNNLQSSIALNNYWLAAGTYSVVFGGDSLAALASSFTPDDDITPRGLGISLKITDVAAVPVPAAIWMMMGGLMGLLGLQKRRMVA